MNMLDFHVRERGALDLTRRVGTLFRRFGVSASKMSRALQTFLEVTGRHGCTPTFFATAVPLGRNPDAIQRLRDQGAELAVHGYVHTDYAQLDLAQQKRHLEMACDLFHRNQVPFTGFRCPYYRWNEATWQAHAELGFLYSSNQVAHWDFVKEEDFTPPQWASFRKAIELYSSRPAAERVLLPYFFKGMVEIPVSIPDDEAMVERLRIRPAADKARIWGAILEATHARGETFTLSLHPERIYHCQEALDATLARARQMQPTVWVAPLGEVDRWWRERSGFSIRGAETSPGHYAIQVQATSRATVLARGVKVNRASRQWYGAYNLVEAAEFEVESPVRPFVGVPPDASQALVDFLASEGHVVERSPDRLAYGVYIQDMDVSQEKARRQLIDSIEGSPAPLVRLWRWPGGARSCLSITGDIDSITLVDFVLRPFEV